MLFFALVAIAACGTAGTTDGETSRISGAGAASTSNTASSASGTGGGVDSLGAPYPIVLAHGFFGFETFAGINAETYFFGVKDDLAAHGERDVFTPAVDPFNDSTFRGAELAEAVSAVLAKTGRAKVNLIGHSQGGLDARVVAHDHPEWIASVTTIATPHFGSPVADVAMKLLADPNSAAVVDWFAKTLGGPLFDQIGNTTSLAKPLLLFSKPGIAAFNAKYPDVAGLPYFSIAGRSSGALTSGACKPDLAVSFTTSFDLALDTLDPALAILAPILSGTFVNQHTHDGLVRSEDSRWGTFLGCVPADHLDEIGQLLGDGPGLGNPWRHQPFFRDLVAFLRSRGL